MEVTKKGVGTWRYDGVDRALASAPVSWFYTWKPDLAGCAQPAVAEFVPMAWGAGDVAGAAAATGDTLLGFNEPDIAEQAALTVEQALDLWPQLDRAGRRLGSPAPSAQGAAEGGWLDRFLTGAQQRGHRVDFVALHWYGTDFTDPAAATTELSRFLTTAHERYGKPIWLTEYALADFSGGVEQARYPSSAEQAAFAAASLPVLDRLPFVERYAWFALSDTGSSFRTGLYDADGEPTRVGQAYLRS